MYGYHATKTTAYTDRPVLELDDNPAARTFKQALFEQGIPVTTFMVIVRGCHRSDIPALSLAYLAYLVYTGCCTLLSGKVAFCAAGAILKIRFR